MIKGGVKMRKKTGQSILEYVIILTVIVAAIAIGAKSYLQPAVDKSLDNIGESINASTGSLPGVNNTN
jgi:Flp pilus assembly pilin Flp